MMPANYIGKPQNRVDGRLKATGAAKYSAAFNAPDLLYGYVVSSHIAKDEITKFDLEKGAIALTLDKLL